jgi:D-galactarolactone cycloisomerase
VDQALWDIVGKTCGKPLYKLWGGSNYSLRAYAAPIEFRISEEIVDAALRIKELGFKAIKLRLHNMKMKDDLKLVEAVKDA